MNINVSRYELKNLNLINIIIGKNGCGKSTLLRQLDTDFKASTADINEIRYVSPERGGELTYDAGILNTISNNNSWASDSKRKNRVENYRNIVVSQFSEFEIRVLREIEANRETRDSDYRFDLEIDKLNSLLDNLALRRQTRGGSSFVITGKDRGETRNSNQISSGEAELITLAIEILSYAHQSKKLPAGKFNVLLLDEPDVHLHPDLQAKLMMLLADEVESSDLRVFIATHSTAILGSSKESITNVCFMKNKQEKLSFHCISDVIKKVIPVFGAHPLSNVFSQRPILLVEGDDEERMWQQAIRSSEGRINLWPCVVGDVQSMHVYETLTNEIIESVYDGACAYSVRDGDDIDIKIDDFKNVERFRLNCKAAENLILTDDVLVSLGSSWDEIKRKTDDWLVKNEGHVRYRDMQQFQSDFDRKNRNVKNIRLILMDMAGSNKPWEVAVGQAIANLDSSSPNSEGGLKSFLGDELVNMILS